MTKNKKKNYKIKNYKKEKKFINIYYYNNLLLISIRIKF